MEREIREDPIDEFDSAFFGLVETSRGKDNFLPSPGASEIVTDKENILP
jgi:hypothetical protein